MSSYKPTNRLLYETDTTRWHATTKSIRNSMPDRAFSHHRKPTTWLRPLPNSGLHTTSQPCALPPHPEETIFQESALYYNDRYKAINSHCAMRLSRLPFSWQRYYFRQNRPMYCSPTYTPIPYDRRYRHRPDKRARFHVFHRTPRKQSTRKKRIEKMPKRKYAFAYKDFCATKIH